jgi:hypothetical protein
MSQCSNDTNTPISQIASDEYALALTPSEKVALAFCFFCGGRRSSDPGFPCRCSMLVVWRNRAGSCVRQDSRFGEFQVHYDGNKLIMHFCPNCGGNLPRSKRSEFFLEPTQEEIEDFERRLNNVQTLEDVVRILGEPSRRFSRSEIDEKDKRVFGVTPIRDTLYYSGIAQTLELCAQEDETGKVNISFLKKPKG